MHCSGMASGGFLLPVPGDRGERGQLPVPAAAGAALQPGATQRLRRPLHPQTFLHALFHPGLPARYSFPQTQLLPLQWPGETSSPRLSRRAEIKSTVSILRAPFFIARFSTTASRRFSRPRCSGSARRPSGPPTPGSSSPTFGSL